MKQFVASTQGDEKHYLTRCLLSRRKSNMAAKLPVFVIDFESSVSFDSVKGNTTDIINVSAFVAVAFPSQIGNNTLSIYNVNQS